MLFEMDAYTIDMLHRIVDAVYETALEQRRPSTIYKPFIYPDGNMWCALYGENIQKGVCGFGSTPDEACLEFDRVWTDGGAPDASPTSRPPD